MGGTLPERLGRLPPIVYRGGVIRQISAGHRLLRDPVRANMFNTGRRAGVPLDRRNRNTATALIRVDFGLSPAQHDPPQQPQRPSWRNSAEEPGTLRKDAG